VLLLQLCSHLLELGKALRQNIAGQAVSQGC
jgi:hypothetical protein